MTNIAQKCVTSFINREVVVGGRGYSGRAAASVGDEGRDVYRYAPSGFMGLIADCVEGGVTLGHNRHF